MEPQVLWIGDPKPGRYEVRITGWPDVGADPGYVARADRIGVGGTLGPIIAVAGATAPLQEDTFDFELVPNQAPAADAGPDQTVAAGPNCTASVTLDGSGSSDPDGDTLYYSWQSPYGTTYEGVRPTLELPLGSHTIQLSVNDGKGQVSRDSLEITVEDRTAPTITVPERMTAEQTSLAGTPVVLPDPCTAVDASGNAATARTTVTVVDSKPPVIQKLVARPSSLWPPNHKLVPVEVTPTVKDVCDARPRCRIAAVASSDPVTGKGDNTRPDWRVTGDLSLELRAERAGGGSGRIYTITVQYTDASGNGSAARTVSVSVPHDQGGGR